MEGSNLPYSFLWLCSMINETQALIRGAVKYVLGRFDSRWFYWRGSTVLYLRTTVLTVLIVYARILFQSSLM